MAVLPHRVAQRLPAHRPLDAPLAGGIAVLENLGWFRHATLPYGSHNASGLLPPSCAPVRSRSRTYELIRSGELPAVKDGRSTLIPVDAAEAWARNLTAISVLSVDAS